MQNPLVSVITNTFNSDVYIKDNIESLIGQSYKNWEHIIVDCGSTDHTIELLEELKHDRLRVIKIPFCGVATARNFGIKQAKGEIIAILDSDDICLPERIFNQVNFLNAEPKFLAVTTAIKTINLQTKRKCTYIYPSSPEQIAIALRVGINVLPHSSLAFRANTFNKLSGYSDYIEKAEDFDFLLRLSDIGPIKSLPVPSIQITVRCDSHTSVHRPKGRDTKFYVALAIILNAAKISSKKDKETVEIWLDELTERGINNLLWYWQARSLVQNIARLDLVTTTWFLRSLIANFNVSLFGRKNGLIKILKICSTHNSYANLCFKKNNSP
jgi:glycosyltransferase involved in cell wall biosynthesis